MKIEIKDIHPDEAINFMQDLIDHFEFIGQDAVDGLSRVCRWHGMNVDFYNDEDQGIVAVKKL